MRPPAPLGHSDRPTGFWEHFTRYHPGGLPDRGQRRSFGAAAYAGDATLRRRGTGHTREGAVLGCVCVCSLGCTARLRAALVTPTAHTRDTRGDALASSAAADTQLHAGCNDPQHEHTPQVARDAHHTITSTAGSDRPAHPRALTVQHTRSTRARLRQRAPCRPHAPVRWTSTPSSPRSQASARPLSTILWGPPLGRYTSGTFATAVSDQQ